MLEKIKQYATVALGLLVAILSAILGFELRKNSTLKDKLSSSDAEKNLGEVLLKAKQAKEVSDESEKDYNSVRDAYLSSQHDDGEPPKAS